MSVTINPSGTLGFHRPLTQLVKRTLTVSNPNAQPVAFKVKTTAPKQYCVRPNSGRIEPGEQVEVQVLLQPMQADPEADAKCRDKFLVQSALITPDRESRPLNELWSLIDKEDKDSISEHKIRCAYLPPLGGDADASTRSANHISSANYSSTQNGIAETAKDTVAAAAAGVGATTVADKLAHNGHAEVKPSTLDQSLSHDSPSDSHLRSESENSSPFKSAIAAPVAAGAAAVTAAGAALGLGSGANSNETHSTHTAKPKLNGSLSGVAPGAADSTSNDTTKLQTELNEAKREIERLKSQLAEVQSGLRQRQIAAPLPDMSSGLKGAGEMVIHGDAGVPLQTVMIAVGVTFAVTWMFF